nr:urease accessory UreF family protein [Streptomyces viridosporus]
MSPSTRSCPRSSTGWGARWVPSSRANSPTSSCGSLRSSGCVRTEFEARTPSPALRATSRRLGRQLLRAARAVQPHRGLDALAAALPGGPHQPVALGAAARALGLGPRAAAAAALHDAATGPATAAVRLLGLDPFAVHAALARLTPRMDRLAARAADSAQAPADALPSHGAPLLDISAELHATWEVRLFAS